MRVKQNRYHVLDIYWGKLTYINSESSQAKNRELKGVYINKNSVEPIMYLKSLLVDVKILNPLQVFKLACLFLT